MHQGNVGREIKRRAAIRHDFGRKAAKRKRGSPLRVTSAALQTLVTAPGSGSQYSEYFNPANRHHSTAPNNQPEIRRKRGRANCCREAQQKNEILVVRDSGCGCGCQADERRFAAVRPGVGSTGGRCGTGRRGGPASALDSHA